MSLPLRAVLAGSLCSGLSLCLLPLPCALADTAHLMTQPTLTGNWGGQRQRLEDQGIKLTGDYTSETISNLHGGIKRGTRYAQQIRLGAQFDLSKLLDTPDAGRVQVLLNDRRGHSATEDLIGNRMSAQEVYGGEYTRLTELSYQRTLFSPDLSTKLGYMVMGTDFGGMPILANFVSAGFCAHPLTMSSGSGWGNYPTAHWGGELRYDVNPSLTLQTALFQVNPGYNARVSKAFAMPSNGTTGAILPLEAIINNRAFLNGQYKVGWYYDTSDYAKIGGTGKSSSRTGAYLLVDQAIWRDEQDPASVLRLFGQAATSNAATSPMRRWYSLGLVKQKPFASRPQDSISFGYGRAVINPRTRGVQEAAVAYPDDTAVITGLDSGEQVLELNYGAQVTPWLLLRPDVQYYIEPGAFFGKQRGNALAAGLQVKMTF
ncbi:MULTISPECIES: carbohydrate porin [Pseudomonas]|uniref:Carbohydrate porin n=1 Tax=Pseudomonas capeferrum TaxID=1495066 RepID=A0ABY7RB93_9PSED|nr:MULTISPECIES: carbohydrate porin [Pseudomonas]MUT52694.1 carbohydrate porin [Pseudomonas sp. TDA1]WCI00700.1 carbohydrate porin [Pseudomonas capeferrum]